MRNYEQGIEDDERSIAGKKSTRRQAEKGRLEAEKRVKELETELKKKQDELMKEKQQDESPAQVRAYVRE